MKKRNQCGFAVVEILLILIIVGAIAGVAYYVSQRNKDSSQTNTQTSDTTNSQVSKDEQKVFQDKRNGISFEYPANWKVDIKKVDDAPVDGKGDFLEGTITSPSGKIVLSYATFSAGIGGGHCPYDFPCGTISILDIQDIPGIKDQNTKFISKISERKGNDNNFVPAFGIKTLSTNDPLTVGDSVRDDFYLTNDLSPEGTSFQLTSVSQPTNFKTYAEAKAFLDSDEAKIARQIILSTTKN